MQHGPSSSLVSSASSSSVSSVSYLCLRHVCHHSSLVVDRLVSFAATNCVEQHLSVGKHVKCVCTPFLPSFWGVSIGYRQLPQIFKCTSFHQLAAGTKELHQLIETTKLQCHVLDLVPVFFLDPICPQVQRLAKH